MIRSERGNFHESQKPPSTGYELRSYRMGVVVHSWKSTAAPAAGTVITVTASGKGNYSGTASASYRIIAAGKHISKAKTTAVKKDYTGRSITLTPDKTDPSKGDLVVSLNGVYLKYGTDYEIIGYSRNINTGTALVRIRGIGTYGGEKTVQFKINKNKAVLLRNIFS